MIPYAVRRLPSVGVVLFVASVLIFLILRAVPGDPAAAVAGPDATPEMLARIRADLGLDRPLPEQYVEWLRGLLTLDLGRSYSIGGDVGALVGEGFVNTLMLVASGLLLSVVFSLVVSVAAVALDRSWLNGLVNLANTLAVAVPTFATGVLSVLIFAVLLQVLPAGGLPPGGFLARPDWTLQYLMLPAICLALPITSVLTRFLIEALRTQMQQPYVLTANALGISRRRILFTQVLPNALPPSITVLGIQTGHLLGGSILIEVIFAWPGLGQLAEKAISSRDYPVVQALLLLSVGAFVTIQLATDLVHAWLDPRIRLGG